MTTEGAGLREAVATRIDGLRHTVVNSRFVKSAEAAGSFATTAVQNSWLYGWLTAEPEPEVIVIDLRETYTVGPFIRLLDWAIEEVTPWYRQSALKRGVDPIVAVGEWAAETRLGQLLVKLLEPPEPPEDRKDAVDKPQKED